MGQDVYRATDFNILPLNPNISANYPPHPVEGHLLALVRSHLFESCLLFSYGWDITTRLQMQWASQETSQRKGLWEVVRPQLTYHFGFHLHILSQADNRFFWNKYTPLFLF